MHVCVCVWLLLLTPVLLQSLSRDGVGHGESLFLVVLKRVHQNSPFWFKDRENQVHIPVYS